MFESAFLNSDVLTLTGMSELGTDETDTYVLSMSYFGNPKKLGKGCFGLAAKDADGDWVNAVDMSYGGCKKFVNGPWKPEYGLGTYGVDPCTGTAWGCLMLK